MQTIVVSNGTTGCTIGEKIECATTTWTRLIGLLGRSSLATGEGLWISPSSGVHTFGMTFAIDVVGLDDGLQVVKLWPTLQPNRLTPLTFAVRSVLELPEGQIARQSIRLGDKFCFSPE